MDPATEFDRTEPKRCEEATRELVHRALADPQAMGEIYLVYYDRVFNYAMRRLINEILSKVDEAAKKSQPTVLQKPVDRKFRSNF